MTALTKIAEARRRALAAAEADPCPQLTAELRENMIDSALDVLIHNHGVCEANHLTVYGFTEAQIVGHWEAIIGPARERYRAQKGGRQGSGIGDQGSGS